MTTKAWVARYPFILIFQNSASPLKILSDSLKIFNSLQKHKVSITTSLESNPIISESIEFPKEMSNTVDWEKYHNLRKSYFCNKYQILWKYQLSYENINFLENIKFPLQISNFPWKYQLFVENFEFSLKILNFPWKYQIFPWTYQAFQDTFTIPAK